MVETGLLSEDAPYELIEGELIEMSPQGTRHSVAGELVAQRLIATAPEGTHVRAQRPLDCGDESVPEPDVALVLGAMRDFIARHPRADEVLLVVEVSMTTQDVDHRKAAIYARAGAPVYWLLDLQNRRLEVHAEPHPDGYHLVRILEDDDAVEVPGAKERWPVRELLP